MFLFLHYFGVSLWIGGAAAVFVLTSAIRDRPAAGRNALLPLVARIHAAVIAPGAVVSALTGLMLAMSLTNRGGNQILMSPGFLIMEIGGVVGAVLAIFVALPAANQVAAFAASAAGDDALPPPVEALFKRQSTVTWVAVIIAVVSLLGVTAL